MTNRILTERQIISLLLARPTPTPGHGANGTSTAGSTMKTQALSLLAGQAGEQLTREARQALRLSTFRIDPGMIQSESETAGPRLTLGDDITSKLGILYSMSLEGGGKEIVSARYDIARRLSVQTTKQRSSVPKPIFTRPDLPRDEHRYRDQLLEFKSSSGNEVRQSPEISMISKDPEGTG